jgi:DNA-binding response OmpR family regulator
MTTISVAASARPPRVLVVDDEPPIVELVRGYLVRDGMDVRTATDGPGAIAAVRDREPDVVVLDVMLPGIDGIEVCRQLRTFSDVYVIMLTARGEEIDRVVGLSVGADDYLVKPFAYEELVARLRALDRRAAGHHQIDQKLTNGPILLDQRMHRVEVAGRVVELTRREFTLLECLLRHPGQVLSRDQLLDYAWPFGDDVTHNTVEAYVHLLRSKLGPDAGARIVTVHGAGYRMVDA